MDDVRTRLRVLGQGADLTLLSPLCALCPHGPKGCCVVPPRMALADVARIVTHHGRDWLLTELESGRLIAGEAWLILRRTDACGYLGPTGCTIAHERRPATCNFYVCESALDAGDDRKSSLRGQRDLLEATYARWDHELEQLARERSPSSITFDAATLDFLGVSFQRLCAATRAVSSPT